MLVGLIKGEERLLNKLDELYKNAEDVCLSFKELSLKLFLARDSHFLAKRRGDQLVSTSKTEGFVRG